jgi:3-oxoacyl-[acyl-carrier-protein] synthase III
MAFLAATGSYLPAQIRTNAELGAVLNKDPAWIFEMSGIEERRVAENETLVDLAVEAGKVCLQQNQPELIIVATGSAEQRFPGPAAAVAHRLGLTCPAIDLPMASAGSLFGLALAADLTARYQSILVIAAEKMSSVMANPDTPAGIAILFGDGAGAALVTRDGPGMRIKDHILASAGEFEASLKLPLTGPMEMDGMSVIMQASRNIPAAILALLQRNQLTAVQVAAFVMHQANQNLLDRVSRRLGVATDRFASNISRYGNTSSASLLIALDEYLRADGRMPVCLAAFGAGFHWGAVLLDESTSG